MNPIAFTLFGFEIRWYGVIIAMGVLCAMLTINILSKARGINYDTVIDAFLITFPVAIVCARLYYVLFEYKNYHTFKEVINIRGGGLAIHGGVIGALIAGYIFAKYKKINFLKFVDVIMPGVILAQAIGRWGNFMNQEAHGGEVTKEFISKFPQFIQKGMFIDGAYYHPTFLYESLWNILVFIILVVICLKKKENENGSVLGGYLIFYSIGRFFIEGLRTDSLMVLGLRTAQLASLLGIILGVILITYTKVKSKKLC